MEVQVKQKFEQVRQVVLRIWRNLKWLFNHPPLAFTSKGPEGVVCDYCGRKDSLFAYTSSNDMVYCFCWPCLFKALDAVLIARKEKS